ncbi:hexokinase-domain-containing protein [Thamnocephalis sphaerospora]|uniref:Phosphotransferase n=1 Tax=Thamnocephalis sphaerospora TaxID=78915 RepID=A0A4P9XQZ8_9FUNG|nr:hexokinase-domain-containing protein [Thamnocephalis sphaerospora]|eukprot:RKP08342.1 hexokinase-domain-containing protein [Thamnocephalis sphaerospora]
MIPTYVVGRLTGNETGSYLSLDLGGTNMRVCLVRLLGKGEFTLRQRKFTIPEAYKVGLGRPLFDYMAECVGLFLDEARTDQELLPLPDGRSYALGFTFSFPLNQTAVDRGTLMRWTKSFNLPDVIDKDVVQLLQSAMDRLNLNVRVTAIINDTVGCLLANAYRDPNTQIGVILGTGNNAAYYERIPQITKWTAQHDPAVHPATRGETEMIINCEWGAFDNERRALPRTRFDARVDRMTHHVFCQLFEKMSAGMYLGELLRLVLLDLIDRRLLFDGYSSDILNRPMSVDTAYMSAIEADTTADLEHVRRVLEDVLDMPAGSSTLLERQIVQRVCALIGLRSARLGAVGLTTLLSQREDQLSDPNVKLAIAVDGSLFEHYPCYPERLKAALEVLLGEDCVRNRITLGLAKDGSGVGAALGAMLAEKRR